MLNGFYGQAESLFLRWNVFALFSESKMISTESQLGLLREDKTR